MALDNLSSLQVDHIQKIVQCKSKQKKYFQTSASLRARAFELG
jgi:hypothetical protein